MAIQLDRAKELFLDALDLESPDDRRAFLDGACGGDAGLRAEVEDLLAHHPRVGSFLEAGAHNLGATSDLGTAPAQPDARIGPYKLREQLGEGGMGVVYVADQEHPVKRRVALKVIKPGMDTRQVVARFEAERQALALMDRPNIARILDGGTTEQGRPYFVMELVRGMPVTDYCDRAGLTTRERLELFAQVCAAVQHAHQKGVIHRDLKPSNVLVTLYDGRPVPKVIDFGIAKAVGASLADHTVYTRVAQLVGTPLYMAPEQAELSALDVDTRSDVYALGVLLYELLTGTTPFDAERFRSAGLDEVRRIIREDEPPRPSQRLSTLGAQARSTVSERWGVDDRQLGRQLRGELDWVVMKCLEKDRDRRYQSAGDLAADVQRYLADEPVAACPPSPWYRVRKFWRRNRRALVTAGLVAASLVAATAVSVWQANVARDAQREAEADRDRAETAERRSATEAAIARAVNDFLQVDLLRQVNRSSQFDGESGGHSDLTVKEALDRAAARIDERFRDQPPVEAVIRMAIGEAYMSLDLPQPAVRHFKRAFDLRRASLGDDHPETLGAVQSLAESYTWTGRRGEAVALQEAVAGKYEHMFGPDHATTLDALLRLAGACEQAEMWDRAIALLSRVVERQTVTLGPDHDVTVEAAHRLARCYLNAGRIAESLTWHEKTLVVQQDRNSWWMNTYARSLQAAGRLDEADSWLRRSLEVMRKRSDRRAREMGISTVQKILGLNLLLQGRYAEAETAAREALAILERETPDNWSRFHAMSLVGGALLGQRRYAEAEPFLVQGYEGIKQREALMNAGFQHWLTQAGERVVRFYEATNQPEKVREWREKLQLPPDRK